MYYPSSENKGADQLRGTAKLICFFVFAYADCWLSHEAAQMCYPLEIEATAISIFHTTLSSVISIPIFGAILVCVSQYSEPFWCAYPDIWSHSGVRIPIFGAILVCVSQYSEPFWCAYPDIWSHSGVRIPIFGAILVCVSQYSEPFWCAYPDIWSHSGVRIPIFGAILVCSVVLPQ